MPHGLVVLVQFGELEERLDEGAMVRAIAPVVEVTEERLAREGADVAVPAIGEALELLRGRGLDERVEEAVVAGGEGLVEKQRGRALRRHRERDYGRTAALRKGHRVNGGIRPSRVPRSDGR